MSSTPETQALSNLWVSLPPPNSQPRLRLFCFPYAGGSASSFRLWGHPLETEIEVCPVHLPGRERRIKEPPIARLDVLVPALATALRPHLNQPFAFFGHSMGALLSFELARELRRQNAPCPTYLLLSGRHAPQLAPLVPPIHQLPQSSFIDALCRYQGMPDAILQDAEIMQILLPILRADFALCETYVYTKEPPFNCPIAIFGGLQDDYADLPSLKAWKSQTRNAFSLQMFPGHHFFLNTIGKQILQSINHQLTQHREQSDCTWF
jgi:medium-chain acyl-[acyl-carrier-protein] hydrolase